MVFFRSLGPFWAMRPLEFRTMELGPGVMLLHVLVLALVPVVLPDVLVMLVLAIVLHVLAMVMPVVIVVTIVMLGVLVPVTLHVAHFHAQLVRDLAPSHAARAQLQHAG